MLTVGSLFSGVGLCDLGLAWAGFDHQWFCEIDPFCRAVLTRHWPDTPIYSDVSGLKGAELPPVDVLCGGFPCQDVSGGSVGAACIRAGRGYVGMELSREYFEISRARLEEELASRGHDKAATG